MNTMTKEQFRVNVYQLIEELASAVAELTAVETGEPSYTNQGNLPNAVPSDNADGFMFVWDYSYRFSPNDPNSQAFKRTVATLYDALNSRDGVRMLPRGLYRLLVEFSDKCIARLAWLEWRSAIMEHGSETEQPSQGALKEATARRLGTEKKSFLEEIKVVRREIHYFENERDESEASFFGPEHAG